MRQLQYVICFFVLLLAGAVYFSLKFAYIGSDAPYYLSVARDISSGLIPYKDIFLSYTPLVMYFNAAVFEIFPDFEYSIFLLFQYMVIFLGGGILYTISTKYIESEKQKSLLLSLFFVVAVLSSDGNDVILEAYSALFVLLGLLFFFREKIFWTGFFLGLSFFCKQFGLLNFIPFFLYFFLKKDHRPQNLFFMSAGGLVPLLLFLLYFAGFQNIPLDSLFSQLNGADYVSHTLISWGGIETYLIGAKVFVLLLIPLFFYNSVQKDKLNIFLGMGVLVNLLPLMLQNFQHYYVNTFPFLFILIGRVWARAKDRIVLYHAFAAFIIAGLFYLRIFRYKDRSVLQEVVSQSAEMMVEQNRKVFIYGNLRYLYLMNDYKNPVVSKVGYSYPYKPDKTAMDTVRVISGSKISGAPDKKIKVQDDYLYLYLEPEIKAADY